MSGTSSSENEELRLISELRYALDDILNWAEFNGPRERYAQAIVKQAEAYMDAHGGDPLPYGQEPPLLTQMVAEAEAHERQAAIGRARLDAEEALRRYQQLRGENGG